MNTFLRLKNRTYQGNLEEIVDSNTPPAIGTGTPQRIGNTLYPEATGASLRKAIDESWKFYRKQYEGYELEAGVNYPSEDWARSQGGAPLPIELAPGETRLSEGLEVPANMQIRGSGNWAGSTLRMTKGNALELLGDMSAGFGLVKPFGGGLSRIRFAGSDGPLIKLYGSFQDLRLDNLHIISKGSDQPDIYHVRIGEGTYERFVFAVVNMVRPHIKELKVRNCQFESGNTTLYLTAPMRCEIVGNQFLYGELGIAAHEAAELYVANNTFNGGLKCPAIIEGSNEKGWVTFANNAIDGCERGAQLYLANASREVSDANNFWNGGLDSKAVDYYNKRSSVQHGYGVFKSGDAL